MAAANQGDVEITLGEDKVTLRCTLRAAKDINAAFGSFSDAHRRVSAFDLAAFVTIIAFGANKQAKAIEDTVFQTGMNSLLDPLKSYIELLANGGKPTEAKSAGDEPAGEE
jgi:hypothetical protein